MSPFSAKILFALQAGVATTLTCSSTEVKYEPLDLVGRPAQRAYPAYSSLYAKLAYVEAVLRREEYTSLPWTPTLQAWLGTSSPLDDALSWEGGFSAHTLLARIRRGLERLPVLFPQSYEAVLGRVQGLLGAPQDTTAASTAMGYLNEIIALLAKPSREEQEDQLPRLVGTLQDSFGQESFLQSLHRTLFALTLEPLTVTYATPGFSSISSIWEAFRALETRWQEQNDLSWAFAEETCRPQTLTSLASRVSQLFPGFSLVATEEDIESFQTLIGTPLDGQQVSTLWGAIRKIESFPEPKTSSNRHTLRTGLEQALTVLGSLQQKIVESLVDKLTGRSPQARALPSCQTLCQKIQQNRSVEAGSPMTQELSRISSGIQDIARGLSDSPRSQTFDPYHCPRAVLHLWSQLHKACESLRTRKILRGAPEQGQDSDTLASLRNAFSYLAQSFYLPAWRQRLGNVTTPSEKTLLDRLQQLGRELIQRRQTGQDPAEQEEYAELLQPPYFGHVMLHELDKPETFFRRLILLRSALEASSAGLSASVAGCIDALLGSEEETPTNSLTDLLTLMEEAMKVSDVECLKQLSVWGRRLIDRLLLSLYRTVLPKYLSDIQERLQAWFKKNPQSSLSGAPLDLTALRFGPLGTALAAPTMALSPKTVAQIYGWIGASSDVQPLSLFGLVNGLEQGHFSWRLLLGNPDDQYTTDSPTNPTLYGLEKGLRTQIEPSVSEASQPSESFQTPPKEEPLTLENPLSSELEDVIVPKLRASSNSARLRSRAVNLTSESIDFAAQVASLCRTGDAVTRLLSKGLKEWATGAQNGLSSALGPFSQKFMASWSEVWWDIAGTVRSLVNTCFCPEATFFPSEVGTYLEALESSLERLKASLLEICSDLPDATTSPEYEPCPLPEEIAHLALIVAQWNDLWREVISWTRENVEALSAESGVKWPPSPERHSLPRYHLPLLAANVGDVREELRRMVAVVRDQELAEQAEEASASTSFLTSSLQQLGRSVALLRLSFETLSTGSDQVQKCSFATTLGPILRHCCSECFLGEGSTVFCRHKEKPTLFLCWSFDESNVKDQYDDGVNQVETDAQGCILEGRLAGLRIEDFEPISLLTVLKQIAQISEETRARLLAAFKVF